jgi:hypothetical protein
VFSATRERRNRERRDDVHRVWERSIGSESMAANSSTLFYSSLLRLIFALCHRRRFTATVVVCRVRDKDFIFFLFSFSVSMCSFDLVFVLLIVLCWIGLWFDGYGWFKGRGDYLVMWNVLFMCFLLWWWWK